MEPSSWGVGTEVRLCGLTRADLNGELGLICGPPSPETGRWPVQLHGDPDTAPRKMIRELNLQVAAPGPLRLTVDGLVRGLVETGEVNGRVHAAGTPLKSPLSNLMPDPGSMMVQW